MMMIANFVNFAGNFKIVIDKLKLFFKKMWHTYNQILEKSKARLLNRLRGISIFRDVIVFVTSFVMIQVFEQYKRFCCEFTAISACIDNFSKIMKLSCAHKIQERWYDDVSGEVFKLENFHSHWRYIKSTEQENDEEDIEVFGTSSTIERSTALQDLLRV